MNTFFDKVNLSEEQLLKIKAKKTTTSKFDQQQEEVKHSSQEQSNEQIITEPEVEVELPPSVQDLYDKLTKDKIYESYEAFYEELKNVFLFYMKSLEIRDLIHL